MRGPQVLSSQIEICDIDDTNAHLFELASDRYGRLMWDQGSVPAEDAEPGAELTKTWTYFGGGMGETYDVEERIGLRTGGYYFAKNCQASNPFAIRPTQTVTTVTLTNNNAEVTEFFEGASASGTKYLYALNDTQGYKIQISGTPALKNTKDFTAPEVAVATGSYIGTGNDLVRTFSCGFPPKFVLIKADAAVVGIIKIDGMGTRSYKAIDGTFTAGTATNQILLGTAGFAVAGTTNFNTNGRTYYWTAIGGSAAYVKASSFEGDGNDDKDVTIDTGWGQPDALFICTNNSSDTVCFRNKTDTGDETCDLSTSGSAIANIVEASADWPTDGFEVGSDNRANRSAATVYYFALKQDAGTDHCTIGSHTGDGVDPQAVTGVGYESTYVLLYTDSGTAGVKPVWRTDRCAGDATMYFDGTVNAADLIESLDSDGYSVGGADDVNENTKTFYSLMLRTDPSHAVICGQPAEWNDIWELPQGDDVDRVALTTIVDGAGNDTWTARSTGEPNVQHFTVVENELVAARSDRIVSKCSATDTDVDGNWTGDYNVGPPGTVITRLVNVAGECGVATTDGFYLWDIVSTSRQQIPYLAGITDDDNGKGTTVIGNLVLVSTVDGLWRLVSGSTAQVGPDAQRDYVEIEGPSNIPIKLKYYGTAFLGTFIYHACYDGTNYHIIYTRLDPYRPTLVGAKWDFLFTTTSAIKVLFVDSERRLWFPLANNIAYVTLDRGGVPEGGTWGDSAGLITGYFYPPITNMGTSALKRLRMIEFECDNTPANFTWRMGVHRDGGASATIGGDANTADGHNERFWTAGTSDTAREIQLEVLSLPSAGTYTPPSSAPELKHIVLHAEALEEDADLIVCSVQLGENAKEQKAIIDRHLNAGTLKLSNALSGAKETVVLYRRRYHSLEQRGNEPPISACELRFRRSDTS